MKLQDLLNTFTEDTVVFIRQADETPVEPDNLTPYLFCDVDTIEATKTFPTDGHEVPLVEVTLK